MVTDKTFLFIQLSNIVQKSKVDLSHDPAEFPVYDLDTSQWSSGKKNFRTKASYIKFTTNAVYYGSAVQIVINGFMYYMQPVKYTTRNCIFELNLNERVQRDILRRGEVLEIKIIQYEPDVGGSGEITEYIPEKYSLQLLPSQFSRTTKVDDMMVFYNTLNAAIPYIDKKQPTIVYVPIQEDIFIKYISQYQQVALTISNTNENGTKYSAASVYFSGPNDAPPNASLIQSGASNTKYENSFAQKINMIPGKEQFEFYVNDAVVGSHITSNRDIGEFVIKYIYNQDSYVHQSDMVPYYINFYDIDEDEDPEVIKAAFKTLSMYI